MNQPAKLTRREDGSYISADSRFVVEQHYTDLPHRVRSGWKVTDMLGLMVFGGIPTGRATSMTVIVKTIPAAVDQINLALTREAWRARKAAKKVAAT